MNRKVIVLWDVGGVLHTNDYSRFYRKASELSGGRLSADDFKAAYLRKDLERLGLVGNISNEDYLKEIAKIIYPDGNYRKSDIYDAVSLCFGPQNDEMLQIKRMLYQKGYTIGIFSNTTPLHAEIIRNKFPEVYDTYDKSFPAIFSFNVHAIKPDPPMYELIKGFEKVILIDDKVSYLKTGIEQFGWFGIQYTGTIDPSEAIRAIHKNEEKPSKNFLIADNGQSCIEALRKSGIDIK
jgi:FMN phosphatase YigB (HAD superfamily)